MKLRRGMNYYAKAPFRIGLAGGGTDVRPYVDLYGGAVLNVTIDLFARTQITPRKDCKVLLSSTVDEGFLVFDRVDELLLPLDDNMNLQKGVYNRIIKEYNNGIPLGLEMTTSLDVLPGSGLGTSSTLVVSMIGAFNEWLGLSLSKHDIAKLAYEIERIDLNMSGGRQDQYAAVFGGVNFIEFNKAIVTVTPLDAQGDIIKDVESCMLLCYTKTTRESAKIIDNQIQNVVEEKTIPIQAMHHLKEQAFSFKEALQSGNLNFVANSLNKSWEHKKNMANGISNSVIDKFYEKAMNAGALGGKISGAGGGGFMVFFTSPNKREDVIGVLKEQGGEIKDFQFEQNGLTTWKA